MPETPRRGGIERRGRAMEPLALSLSRRERDVLGPGYWQIKMRSRWDGMLCDAGPERFNDHINFAR